MRDAPKLMWWCPTCRRRIPQPRWRHVGKPDQWSYHLIGTIAHTIERVPVMDGEVVSARREIEGTEMRETPR